MYLSGWPWVTSSLPEHSVALSRIYFLNKKLQNFGGKTGNADLVSGCLPHPHCVQADTSLYPIFKF